MKFFRLLSISYYLLLATFSIHSMEHQDLALTLEQLKTKLPILQTAFFRDGRPLPTNEDCTAIEEALGDPLPSSLKEFYLAVGNRKFPKVHVAMPHEGIKSDLFTLIRQGHNNGIPKEWIPFCKIDEDNVFCISRHQKGEPIYRFVSLYLPENNSFLFKVYFDDKYDHLGEFINKKWLN